MEQIIKEADNRVKRQLPKNSQQKIIEKIIQEIRANRGVDIKELSSGSRPRLVSEARRIIARRLVEEYGIPLSEIARRVGVSPFAVSKMIAVQ